MRIEKISDNKIKCILTKEDLDARQIRISELAYGSDKARALFRDMLLEAHRTYGFSNEANMPLMIEAIPGSGTLTVIITKVEEPEELDTRFAKFSASAEQDLPAAEHEIEGADDITKLFKEMMEHVSRASSDKEHTHEEEPAIEALPKKASRGKKRLRTRDSLPTILRAYHFSSMEEVIRAASALGPAYKGINSLYRGFDGSYVLVLYQTGILPEEFNKLCNILSEYGKGESFSAAREHFLKEHGKLVIEKKAIQKLRGL